MAGYFTCTIDDRTGNEKAYSGETEVRPQSSQRRYSTGSDSDLPITFALGTPQRGQTMPEVERFAMGVLLYCYLDC